MSKPGAKRGPKPIEIDWAEFDKLCTLQATLIEIAGWFQCSPDTIERRVEEAHSIKFADYWAQKAAGGKISLRRSQWQLAQKGNATMLIWLGKQYLAQLDKQETVHELSDTFKVILEDYTSIK